MDQIKYYLTYKEAKDIKLVRSQILHTGTGNSGQSYLGHGRTEDKGDSILLHNLAYIYEISAVLGVYRSWCRDKDIPGGQYYQLQNGNWRMSGQSQYCKFNQLKKIQQWLQDVMSAMYQDTVCPEVPYISYHWDDVEDEKPDYVYFLLSQLKDPELDNDYVAKIKDCMKSLFVNPPAKNREWSWVQSFNEALALLCRDKQEWIKSCLTTDSYQDIKDKLDKLPGVVRDFILPSGPAAGYFWAATLIRRIELQNAKDAMRGDKFAIKMRPTLNILSAWLYGYGFVPFITPELESLVC